MKEEQKAVDQSEYSGSSSDNDKSNTKKPRKPRRRMTSSEKKSRQQKKLLGETTQKSVKDQEKVLDENGKCIGRRSENGTFTPYKQRGRQPKKETAQVDQKMKVIASMAPKEQTKEKPERKEKPTKVEKYQSSNEDSL